MLKAKEKCMRNACCRSEWQDDAINQSINIKIHENNRQIIVIILHRRDLLVCRVALSMAEGEVARSTSSEAMVFIGCARGDHEA